MKLNVYSIFDSASAIYDRPFFMNSDAQAVRSFTDVCGDADHPIGQHPEDYSLVRIGIFDNNNGKLSVEDKETIITGLEAFARGRQINQNQMSLLENSNNGSAQ